MDRKNLSSRMHPGVVRAIPNSPEARDILEGQHIRSLTLGDLLTRLVEDDSLDTSDGMETIRSSMCELVSISPTDFDWYLQGGEPLSRGLLDRWGEEVKNRVESAHREAVKAEVVGYVSNKLAREMPDPHKERLQELIDEQAQIVQAKQQELEDLAIRNWTRIPLELSIKRHFLPRLEDLENSRFAISVKDLLDFIKTDAFLLANGEEFQASVVDWFCDSLQGNDFLIDSTSATSFFRGEIDEDAIDDLDDIWLAETDLNILGPAYVHAQHYATDKGVYGYKAQHPLLDAIYITDSERKEFFGHYPLASPPKGFRY